MWQRGTSLTDPASASYLADRFVIGYNGTGASRTWSQQTFTPGTAPVAGYEGTYFLRCNTTNAGSGNTTLLIRQPIEDVRTFAGQTVTFSFWMKSGTTGRNCEIDFTQLFGSGGSAQVDGTNVAFTSSSSWTRHSFVIAIPSVSGKTIGAGSNINFRIFFESGIIESFDIWGVQVEAGSVATAFQTATGNIQGELAACQRYYYKWVEGMGSGSGVSMGLGANYSATQLNLTCSFAVTMRSNPTLVAASAANYYKFERNGASDTFNSLTIFHSGVSQAMLYNNTEISGTAGQAGSVSTDNNLASVAFSAEL